ncbi:hypothetical protein D0B54_10810 [Solimonas sp. K1W22B-7]|uniref:hypothetical protein n=1 Tax=Solimonas sp. K1W22B-7 TaxID=2303331 RepID=UPI000E3358AF|nr:hypothetical protein [Solimonas sp. K1W22B-7]AXQ31701.1 hypothetical protein D0B54_10810 [Solimonas sp. K1W22B-7]
MTTQTRHFVLTPEGGIREFSTEQAALIAAGARSVPELADLRVRYLQLTLDDSADNGELKVQTSGASIEFDADGRLREAGPPADSEQISRFEHDTVVQWALKSIPAVAPTFH